MSFSSQGMAWEGQPCWKVVKETQAIPWPWKIHLSLCDPMSVSGCLWKGWKTEVPFTNGKLKLIQNIGLGVQKRSAARSWSPPSVPWAACDCRQVCKCRVANTAILLCLWPNSWAHCITWAVRTCKALRESWMNRPVGVQSTVVLRMDYFKGRAQLVRLMMMVWQAVAQWQILETATAGWMREQRLEMPIISFSSFSFRSGLTSRSHFSITIRDVWHKFCVSLEGQNRFPRFLIVTDTFNVTLASYSNTNPLPT